jgi:hypothetical protein
MPRDDRPGVEKTSRIIAGGRFAAFEMMRQKYLALRRMYQCKECRLKRFKAPFSANDL